MIYNICNYSKCTGCSACMNACPVEAITMQEGFIGHIFPSISEKCIECNKCVRTCPVNTEVVLVKPRNVYAAWVKDDNDHHTSTSGGVASCFTSMMLDDNGVVYGCVSLPRGEIKHIRVTEKSAADKLKGSKYVHSHIGHVFKQIKVDLNEGRRVLFVGLPCQVAGLKNFIGKKSEGLITVDLICHGIPSQKVLFDYLFSLGFNKNEIDSVQFREKSGYFLSVKQNSRIVYRKPEHQDLYYMAFNDNLCFRDSCFTCRYSTSSRCGDLTIGDFWGLGRSEPFSYNTHGNVSVVLVNTDNGAAFLENCKLEMELVERSLSEAVAGNHNLKNPSLVAPNVGKFHALYGKVDIRTALKRCLWKRRLKAPLLPIVQYLLKKM